MNRVASGAIPLPVDKGTAHSSFPGSAWERAVWQAPPADSFHCLNCPDSRQSLEGSAFPGGAWERASKCKLRAFLARVEHLKHFPEDFCKALKKGTERLTRRN